MIRHHPFPVGIAAALIIAAVFSLGMAVYSYRRTGK